MFSFAVFLLLLLLLIFFPYHYFFNIILSVANAAIIRCNNNIIKEIIMIALKNSVICLQVLVLGICLGLGSLWCKALSSDSLTHKDSYSWPVEHLMSHDCSSRLINLANAKVSTTALICAVQWGGYSQRFDKSKASDCS